MLSFCQHWLTRLYSMDKNGFFQNPISRQEFPEYFNVITNPMAWQEISDKLDGHEYFDAQAFVDDVHLVINNALTFNAKDSKIYRTADRMRSQAPAHLARVLELCGTAATPALGLIDEDTKDAGLPTLSLSTLEPDLEQLMLLLQFEDLVNDNDLESMLDQAPLDALAAVEMPIPKPPRSEGTDTSTDTDTDTERADTSSENVRHPLRRNLPLSRLPRVPLLLSQFWILFQSFKPTRNRHTNRARRRKGGRARTLCPQWRWSARHWM